MKATDLLVHIQDALEDSINRGLFWEDINTADPKQADPLIDTLIRHYRDVRITLRALQERYQGSEENG